MALLKIIVAIVLLLAVAVIAEDLLKQKIPDMLKLACDRLALTSDPVPQFKIDSCFVPMSESKTYAEASESCATFQCGHLAYVSNKAEAKVFGELMKFWGYDNCTSVWTALYKLKGKIWYYRLIEAQRHKAEDIPWYPGQPKNDDKLTGGSFMISVENGKWQYGYFNEPADKKNYYVCQYVKPGHHGCPL